MSNVYKIGRLVQVGVAKESTRGTTPSTATYWPAYNGQLVLDEKRKFVKDQSTYGIIEEAVGEQIVQTYSEATIKGDVTDTSFCLFLLSVMGAQAAALHGSETVVYDNTFTVAESAQHQSLSLYLHDASVQDYSYANAVVSKLEINYELEKFLAYSATIMGQKGATHTAYSPSETQENKFAAPYGTLKVASAVSGLSGATAIPIKSMKITLDASVEAFLASGSAAPVDFFNKEFKISGTIEAIYRNEADFKTAFLAGTPQATLLSLTNTAVTLGSAANPAINITLDQVFFEELTRKIDQKDLCYATMKFNATYSIANSEMGKVLVTNLVNGF